MRRSLLAALAAALLLLPAAADAHSGVRVRGTVTAKHDAEGLITVSSHRLDHVLRVPGSLARIRIGRRVELRGTTLRVRGNGSRVLARGVSIVRSEPRAPGRDRDDERDDDEREVRGAITSLTPLTVAGLTCVVPARISLAGFRVGDRVEMTCDLVRGVWTLRRLQSEDARDHEDDGEDREDRDDDDHSGPRGGSGGEGTGRG